ncbi:streptophobe family protein [Streptomyces sp. RY43-2]|uniref:Streptophobe family protein n=1 Tax=Streptomyces macrolidinus TaxID=2952607 RepID=A0ABT0Z9Q5_9ACTN|nr:streptophobe family protein [Streptomyces macrolidinus]MCN9240486.1 streptophobe family protein [Streptomyces macrolidinus]
MNASPPPGRVAVRAGGPALAPHGWLQALVTVVAGLVVMGVVAALGLWAAGGTGLPDNGFPRVVAASVVAATGGSVRLAGEAGTLADTRAGLTVIPLSVTLAGALVIAAGFLRPLRHRAVTGAAEPAGWAARIAALWLPALIGLALAARQTFTIPLGDIGDLLGISPRVGYTTDLPLTVLFGMLWLAGVLLLALLVSRGAPLPNRLLRFQEPVRPAAHAMTALLLAYVAVGAVIALVVAATRGHPAETFAVILLGLPNLVWLVLTLGLGATWYGRVDGPFALPMPRPLDEVLRTPGTATLNLRTLAAQDGRVWWLLAVNTVLLLAAACVMAVRSPARTRPWQHAVRMAVALTLTVLMICLTCRISAHYGLSLIGIGDLGGGLSGVLFLTPDLGTALGTAAAWGLATGFVGALLARGVRRRVRAD